MPDTWDALIDTAILSPNMDFFGYTITYVSASGAVQIITGVFDEQFLSVSPLGSGPFMSTEAMGIGAPGAITSAKPVLGVQLSQFTTLPAQGDTLSVQPNAGPLLKFKVREVQPDGHGVAKLVLQKIGR